MSGASSSTLESDRQYSGQGCCTKGNWSGKNIAAMVIGFVLCWPIGLVILYWNIKGRDINNLPRAIKAKWSEFFGSNRHHEYSSSENSIFDEFQQTQHDRISELKEEIKNRARSFSDFRMGKKRQEDEAEFKDFMSTNQSQDEK